MKKLLLISVIQPKTKINMNKLIPILLIILVVIVSGCTPADTSQPETTTTTGPGKTQRDDWIQVGTEKVTPLLVFNNELYGRGPGPYTYKLQGNVWVKVGTKEVTPLVVFNNELYGYDYYFGRSEE